MAGQEFPLSINRRRMLTSAAAVAATGIVPVLKRDVPLPTLSNPRH
jgi:hypothetical protein